jgi:hypothetical protein
MLLQKQPDGLVPKKTAKYTGMNWSIQALRQKKCGEEITANHHNLMENTKGG